MTTLGDNATVTSFEIGEKLSVPTFYQAHSVLESARVIRTRFDSDTEIMRRVQNSQDARVKAAAAYVCHFGDFTTPGR